MILKIGGGFVFAGFAICLFILSFVVTFFGAIIIAVGLGVFLAAMLFAYLSWKLKREANRLANNALPAMKRQEELGYTYDYPTEEQARGDAPLGIEPVKVEKKEKHKKHAKQ